MSSKKSIQPDSQVLPNDQADLLAQIEELKQQLAAKEEAHKRLLADYQNRERQQQQMQMRLIQMAAVEVITDLLPVLDNLEMALQHFSDPSLQMIHDECLRTLNQHGLEKLTITEGQEFDPQTMDAIDTAAGKENTIVQVTQAGYRLNGNVIRHAKVIVGKNKSEKIMEE
jgi:molecular chaperone GrpE